jgi:hypothetical protein
MTPDVQTSLGPNCARKERRIRPSQPRSADFSPLTAGPVETVEKPAKVRAPLPPSALALMLTPLGPAVPAPIPWRFLNKWTPKVSDLVERGEEHNLELSIAIHHVRLECPPGQWCAMWNAPGSPRSISHAQTLARIGACFEPLDAPDRACLPTTMDGLDTLRRLGTEIVRQLIQERKIKRETTVLEAQALLRIYQPGAKCKPARSNMKKWLARLQRLRDALPNDGSDREREAAKAALQEIMNRLTTGKEQIK